jgi:hypothetical protein
VGTQPAVHAFDAGRESVFDLIASNDPYAFARGYAYNVSPVTDNAPFFFFTLKAGKILGEKGLRQGIDWKVNLGVLVLLLVLVISLAAVLAFLILPLALQKQAEGSPPVAASAALFRCGGPGLHSGGDCLHPALRAFSGASHLRSDRGDLPADAVERRRQPVLARWLPRTEMAGCRLCWSSCASR